MGQPGRECQQCHSVQPAPAHLGTLFFILGCFGLCERLLRGCPESQFCLPGSTLSRWLVSTSVQSWVLWQRIREGLAGWAWAPRAVLLGERLCSGTGGGQEGRVWQAEAAAGRVGAGGE